MRLWYRASLFVLFSIPLLSLFYKRAVLDLPLIPKELSDEWTLQVAIDRSIFENKSKFLLPVPDANSRQIIGNLVGDVSHPDLVITGDESGTVLRWNRESSASFSSPSLSYEMQVKPLYQAPQMPKSIKNEKISKQMERYLSVDALKEQDLLALERLEAAILDPGLSKMAALKKSFFYVSEEIRQMPNVKTISEAIEIGSGSAYTKVRIFNYLMRRLQIPSRIGIGVQLEPDERLRPPRNQYRLSFFNEVYIDGLWYQIDLANRVMGALPDNFIVLYHDLNSLEGSLSEIQSISIFAAPIRTNKYNTASYSDDLKRTNSLYHSLSLYRLPLSGQSSIYIVLLLPIGAIIVSLFRNIIGFSTFGIFTPVLLSLFFIETRFIFAFSFFSLIIFLGFFQRMLLDKLYLLAVPRISIILTLVIISYILFVLLTKNQSDFGVGGGVLSYFPVVIITILIERFSIDFIEDGALNTFKKLLGTVVISLICYFVFTFNALKQLMFTNPEFLLWAIAANLIIGNYKGYRVSEFMRFKDLSRQVKV
ncbi:MAG TPA: 7TM domain-containing protein [Oligoflexia bacterium]|nr:7TM domain-containing protein [Oligoflexia bacterium]HMP49844.1 7TM domain-containing protein [Oligoflexia bacterium]